MSLAPGTQVEVVRSITGHSASSQVDEPYSIASVYVSFIDYRRRSANANLPTSAIHENALEALRLVQSYLLAGGDESAPTANRFGYTTDLQRDLNPFSKTRPFGSDCQVESVVNNDQHTGNFYDQKRLITHDLVLTGVLEEVTYGCEISSDNSVEGCPSAAYSR